MQSNVSSCHAQSGGAGSCPAGSSMGGSGTPCSSSLSELLSMSGSGHGGRGGDGDGEGGGAAGYTSGTQRPGGSGGGLSNQPPVGTTGGTGTQATNHPVTGISDFEGTPYPNSPPSFSAEGSEQVGSFGNPLLPFGIGFSAIT